MRILVVKIIFLMISLISFVLLFILSRFSENVSSFESVVYIFDISSTMEEKSVYGRYGVLVSKFEKSKQIAYQLADDFFKNGKKNWIIIFADQGFYYLPPTRDRDYFYQFLSWLTTNFFHQKTKANLNEALKYLAYTSSGSIAYVFSDFVNNKTLLNSDLEKKLKDKSFEIYFVDIDWQFSDSVSDMVSTIWWKYVLLSKESIEIDKKDSILSLNDRYVNYLKYIAALFSLLGL